ncbi:MAG: thioredoxin family protein [Pseudomonadota bacterium]
MVRMTTPQAELGWPAPDFELPGVDGRRWRLADCRGERGTLVMFICNHCPYVQAILDRIIRDARELAGYGVRCVAISANDSVTYPEDSFDNMVRLAQEKAFPFLYLFDASQDVARAYGAVCTPDFFGFDADLRLRYRGRLDESRKEPQPGARRELFEAMVQVARTGEGPAEQWPSMGCSIKWRGEGG